MELVKTGERITLYLEQKLVEEAYSNNEILKLVFEDDNEHDPGNAIRVEFDGKKQGYVTKDNPRTLIPGTIPNTEARDIIGVKNAYARVDVSTFRKIGNFAYQYEAELLVEEEAPAKKKSEIEFSLGGGLTTYPGKKGLQAEVVKSGYAEIKLTKLTDKIIAIFNETESGFVKAEDEDMEVMMQYIEDLPDGLLANAYSVERGSVKCKIVLQSQVKTATVSLDQSVDRVVEEGIISSQEAEERLEFLKKNKVPVVAIANLFNSYVKYPEHIQSRIKKPSTLYVDTSGIIARSVGYINAGKNLRFEGERGVGKNVLTETLSWLFNRPLWEFSSNSQQSNHDIIGKDTFKSDSAEEKKKLTRSFGKLLKFIFPKKDMDDKDMEDMEGIASRLLAGDKELVFEKSSIIEAVEYGGMLILDEFNSSLADVMTILHVLLDDRRRMEINGLGVIEAHKNFVAIATENKNYAGTFQMNQATIDRFVPIVFPKPESIVGMLQSRVEGVNYDTILQVGTFYNKLRDAIQDGALGEDSLTIRGFIDSLEVLDQGISLKDALIDNVANKADDLDDREAIKDLINLSFFD